MDLFLVERYKFILSRIKYLDEAGHRFTSFFQAGMTALIGAGAVAVSSASSGVISIVEAIVYIRILRLMIILLSSFQIASMLATIASWFDYRKEEVGLFEQVLGKGYRELPKAKNFWRWSEFYFLLLYAVFGWITVKMIDTNIIPFLESLM